MSIVDLVRIESAINRYDFWLELRGTRGRDRRAMRRELRDNLKAAATDVGTTRALFGIGSPKELAYAATPRSASRPRWSMGLLWAVVAFGLAGIGLVSTAVVFAQGVDASGTTGTDVTSGIFPWFGTTFHARAAADGAGLSFGFDSPLALLLVPLLVFVSAAAPWRLLRRRTT